MTGTVAEGHAYNVLGKVAHRTCSTEVKEQRLSDFGAHGSHKCVPGFIAGGLDNQGWIKKQTPRGMGRDGGDRSGPGHVRQVVQKGETSSQTSDSWSSCKRVLQKLGAQQKKWNEIFLECSETLIRSSINAQSSLNSCHS